MFRFVIQKYTYHSHIPIAQYYSSYSMAAQLNRSWHVRVWTSMVIASTSICAIMYCTCICRGLKQTSTNTHTHTNTQTYMYVTYGPTPSKPMLVCKI